MSEKLKLLEIEQLTEQQQLATPSANEKQQLAQLPSSSLLPDIMSVVAPAAAIPEGCFGAFYFFDYHLDMGAKLYQILGGRISKNQ